jgi:hypothetical protein
MFIHSDHSIIKTPVESPLGDVTGVGTSKSSVQKLQIDSNETPTSDTSGSEPAVAAAQKNKRHRPKARSDSNRSQKYAKMFYIFVLFLNSCSIVLSTPQRDSIC